MSLLHCNRNLSWIRANLAFWQKHSDIKQLFDHEITQDGCRPSILFLRRIRTWAGHRG
jgi:hypothetical protein